MLVLIGAGCNCALNPKTIKSKSKKAYNVDCFIEITLFFKTDYVI